MDMVPADGVLTSIRETTHEPLENHRPGTLASPSRHLQCPHDHVRTTSCSGKQLLVCAPKGCTENEFCQKEGARRKKPGPAIKGETTSEQKRPLQENTRAVSSSWPVGHQGLEKTCKLKDSATIGSRKHGAGVSKQSRGKVPDVNWTHGEYLSSEGNQ